MYSTSGMPIAFSCSANGCEWSMTWCAPRSRHHCCVSGRDAVAITVSPVSLRASWIRIEPTPPAPPTISREPALAGLPGCTPKRSKSSSHAVIVVNGSAAACAKFRLRGFVPTMRSSTRCSSAFVPGRAIEPA